MVGLAAGVLFAVCFVGLIVLTHRHILTTQSTLELYESITRLIFSEILFFLWILGCSIVAILTIIQIPNLVQNNNTIFNHLALFLRVTVFIYPLIYFLYRYFTLDEFYQRKFEIGSSPDSDPNHLRLLNSLCKELDIAKPPTIAYSSLSDIPTFIYGKKRNQTTLILPTNFDEVISFVARGRKKTAQALKWFILLHELSHIKNGDVQFASLIIPIFGGMQMWLGLVIFSGTINLLIRGDTSIHSGLLVFIPLFFIYLITYLILASTQRVREYLADARAWLYGPTWVTQKVLGSSSAKWASHLTVFELYLALLRPPSRKLTVLTQAKLSVVRWIRRLENNFISQSLKKLVDYILLLHPSGYQRVKSLTEQQYVDEGRKCPSRESAVFAGLGYFIWMISCVFVVGIIGEVIKSTFNVAPDLILNLQSGVTIVAGPVGGHVFPALLFTLPIINSAAQRIKLKDIYSLFERYLIAFSMVLLPCAAFFWIQEAEKLVFLLSVWFFTLTFFIIGFSLLIASGSKSSVDSLSHSGFSSRERISFNLPLLFFLLSYVFLLVQQGDVPSLLEFADITLLWIPTFIFLFLFWGKRPLDWGILDSEILWIKVGTFNRYINISKPYLIAISSVQFAVFLVLPPIVLHHYIHPLIEFSSMWFHLIIAVLAVGLSLLLHAKIRHPLPWNLYGLVAVFGKNYAIGNKEEEQIQKNILIDKFEAGGFYHSKSFQRGTPKIGDMEHTFYAVKLLKTFPSCSHNLENTMEWVLSCECKEGGFANHFQGKPRLSSTYYALELLETTDEMKRINPDLHRNWVLSCQLKNASFKSPHFPISELADTFFALSSLEILESPVREERIGKWVRKQWRTSRKSLKETFWALASLKKLEFLFSDFKEELRKGWYLANKEDILTSRLDTRWEDVLLFTRISDLIDTPIPPKLTRKVGKAGSSVISKLN